VPSPTIIGSLASLSSCTGDEAADDARDLRCAQSRVPRLEIGRHRRFGGAVRRWPLRWIGRSGLLHEHAAASTPARRVRGSKIVVSSGSGNQLSAPPTARLSAGDATPALAAAWRSGCSHDVADGARGAVM
jgi:hypothetical protein